MKTIPRLYRYMVPPFSTMDAAAISRLVSKASRERHRHLETMAAAIRRNIIAPGAAAFSPNAPVSRIP